MQRRDSHHHFFNLRLGLACWGLSTPVLCCHTYAFAAVYYAQIKKIESHVIRDHEEYSMIAFHLNAEGKLFGHLLYALYRTQAWMVVTLAAADKVQGSPQA